MDSSQTSGITVNNILLVRMRGKVGNSHPDWPRDENKSDTLTCHMNPFFSG